MKPQQRTRPPSVTVLADTVLYRVELFGATAYVIICDMYATDDIVYRPFTSGDVSRPALATTDHGGPS